MATIRDTDLLYVQRGETPHNWTGLELKSLVSAAAKDGKLTVGQYLTPNAQQYDGSSNLTINVDATSTSTANKVVVRDNSGNFAGNVITAVSFSGDGQNLTNTGPTLSVASGSQRLVMTNLTSGKMVTGATDSGLAWDASGQLTVDGAGSFTGNVTAALFEGPVSGDVTGNVTGNLTGDVEGNVTGNLTGNITGDVTGNTATATKLKTARSINGTNFDGTANITTAKWGTARSMNGVSVDGSTSYTLEPYIERDDNSDTARYLTFVDNNTAGYKRLNMDTNLTYNPSLNKLYTNIGGDAGSIGGLDSSKFLRSDVDDTAAGALTFNGRVNIRSHLDISDGQNVDFGSSDDVRINYNGTNNWMYCDFRTGNGIVFRDNGTDTIVLEDSGIFRPSTNNTGTIGTSSFYWNNGYFQNFNVASTLNVRGAIDLADNDILRFGSGDDAELFCNGSHLYLDLNSGIGNFYIRDGSTTRFTFNDNGAFTATNDIISQGNINSTSDVRLKTNIKTLTNPLDKVLQMRGVEYDRIDLEGKHQIGVIAQEIEEIAPELVSSDDDGMKSVSYGNITAILIEAVKEQQKQIDELKKLCQK